MEGGGDLGYTQICKDWQGFARTRGRKFYFHERGRNKRGFCTFNWGEWIDRSDEILKFWEGGKK